MRCVDLDTIEAFEVNSVGLDRFASDDRATVKRYRVKRKSEYCIHTHFMGLGHPNVVSHERRMQ